MLFYEGNELSGLVNAGIRRPSITRRVLSSAFYELLFIDILPYKFTFYSRMLCKGRMCV